MKNDGGASFSLQRRLQPAVFARSSSLVGQVGNLRTDCQSVHPGAPTSTDCRWPYVGTEPPCVSMRADASISAKRMGHLYEEHATADTRPPTPKPNPDRQGGDAVGPAVYRASFQRPPCE